MLPHCGPSSHANQALRVRFGVIDSGRRGASIEHLERELGVTLERWEAAFDLGVTGCVTPPEQNDPDARTVLLGRRRIGRSNSLVNFAHRNVWEAASRDEQADVTVIFEDDAQAAVRDIRTALRHTLASFSTVTVPSSDRIPFRTPDVIKLGWCGD